MESYYKAIEYITTPEGFGPHYWHYINICAMTNDKMYNTLLDIQKTIPCEICKQHMIQYLSQCDPEEESMKLVLELHNRINENNGKDVRTMEEFTSYCANQYGKDNTLPLP